MHVTFGLNLDARQGPSPQSSFNAPVVGRIGFLSLLETYLGLARPEVAAAQRVAVYMGHLQRHDNGARFYSASMKIDSVGTAVKLLSWRDEWLLGGWQGTAQASHPVRLQELAMVETTASDMPPGEATRLLLVEQALMATGPNPIAAISLVDPLEDFPLLWRRVLACLPNVQACPAVPHGEGTLRALQEKAVLVMSGQEPPSKMSPIADGSVQLVRTLSFSTAEHWLGAHAAAYPADRLVLAEDHGGSLDTTLVATGGVNCGFENPSQLRPALQALGLALEMCWAPLDVGRLVDFLTHSVGPFSRKARATLGKAVAEQPGIGGAAWVEAKNNIAGGKDGAALVADIEFWLESERWPRHQGAPLDALLARADKLKEALRRRLSGDPAIAATFAPAHRQCAAVFDSLTELSRQGVTTLMPRQIEQLVAHSTPTGASNPGAISQVGCMRSSNSAAACIEPADEVIWWMPSTPMLVQQLPWSSAEVQTLRELGVELRDPVKQLSALAMQWLRPLLAARKRFVMVLPPPGREVHPVRQLLQQLIPDFEAQALDLDAACSSQFLGSLTAQVKPLPFPQVQRHIQLPRPLKLSTNPQSYTALNELFNAPALFALKRIARLNPTSILAVEEDNRLLGILAHSVFEKLFAHADALTWTNLQAKDWFQGQAGELLRTEGAVLLMQGAGISLQRFQMTCEGAICSLLDHLRAAKAVRVQTEAEFDGVLGPVPLTGKIDLLVELPDNMVVALDMKWRGDNHYARTLREGGHLQLALYSSLVEQKTGTAPAALGFFILESGALFISHSGFFPQAQFTPPPEDVTVAALLDRAKATWSWRTDQFAAGQIEVVPSGPTEDYNGPEGTLQVKGPSQWDRDYLVLLGEWE
ncbi:PD-(D/E)XK nuclease family protein [Comamonas testosteroni]|uniref:PD-(D/E)XK nuclease family protein n=1 Tax=Comamonas testosteroni TaxID=285 RepID=UPI00391C8459